MKCTKCGESISSEVMDNTITCEHCEEEFLFISKADGGESKRDKYYIAMLNELTAFIMNSTINSLSAAGLVSSLAVGQGGKKEFEQLVALNNGMHKSVGEMIKSMAEDGKISIKNMDESRSGVGTNFNLDDWDGYDPDGNLN